MSKTKINITIEKDLLDDVDDYCDKNYLNRSSLISQSLVQVINHQKVIDSLRDASIAIRKVAETGNIDPATKKTLDDFEAIARIMAPIK